MLNTLCILLNFLTSILNLILVLKLISYLELAFRRNMKNKLMPLFDKLILRKRSMIESINNQLKNVFQIEHTRHRSVVNGFINIIAGLVAFTHHDRKPKLNIYGSNIALLQ